MVFREMLLHQMLFLSSDHVTCKICKMRWQVGVHVTGPRPLGSWTRPHVSRWPNNSFRYRLIVYPGISICHSYLSLIVGWCTTISKQECMGIWSYSVSRKVIDTSTQAKSPLVRWRLVLDSFRVQCPYLVKNVTTSMFRSAVGLLVRHIFSCHR